MRSEWIYVLKKDGERYVEASVSEYRGRKIKSAVFNNEANNIHITFDDGIKVQIYDGGQSCCEDRFMTCDDNPGDLNGKMLYDIVVKHVNDNDKSEYEIEETAFLEIRATDGTVISFATHNIHNGYYGGFNLCLEEV